MITGFMMYFVFVYLGKLEASKDGQNGGAFEINLEDLEEVFDIQEDSKDDSNLIQILKQQLEEKDEQINRLHQLLAVAQANADRISRQNQLILEDMQKRKSIWQRIKERLGFSKEEKNDNFTYEFSD
jgi:hypothetical protein